jgi:phosphate:Na+ symporter
MIATILGGVGLFLLGMVLLADGLKAVAGDALRSVLVRFTGGPLRAMASGAAATAVVQSSSATVLTTIGFVSAGLLTFPQAVGVVLGAHVGTTSTGWLVSLLGLRFSVSAVALPLVAAGALMRLLGNGRTAESGLALAGFGLIFVGIDVLQSGMADLADRIDPGTFPGGSPVAWLLLVGVGMVMTVVMQSSSAAVATTLAALHSGAIAIDQAAALVAGQNIGTTVKAALAAIGASTAVRRTALAHILFSVVTGAVAFLLIPAVVAVGNTGAGRDPAVLIAAFHTVFNLLGVVALAPFVGQFAGLVTRMVPERGPHLTRHLDPSLATMPPVALEAAHRTVREVAATFLDLLSTILARPGDRPQPGPLESGALALAETRRFLAAVRTTQLAGDQARHLAVLHTMDHLERLVERLRAAPPAAIVDEPFAAAAAHARAELEPVRTWLRAPDSDSPTERCERLSRELAERRREQRTIQLQAAAAGTMDAALVLQRLDAMRWLDAVAYHVWRAVHHLAEHAPGTQTEARD